MVDKPPMRLSRGELTQQIGQSGLERFGGFVYDDLTPPPGKTWLDVYHLMSETDPVIGASLATFETLASRVMWTMQPADDTSQAQAAADFLDGCLHDLTESWQEILSEIWSMLVYGFAPLEQTYKVRRGDVTGADGNSDPAASSKFDDGRIGWAKWALRSPTTRYKWEFDANGNVLGMYQIAPPNYTVTFLPSEKMLFFRTTTKLGNPEGASILRSAYKSWQRKANIEIIEGIGVERDLAGLPVAEVPSELLRSDATPEEQGLLAQIFKIVTNIKRDTNEGIVWPMQYDAQGHPLYNLKLLSTGGTRQFDTDKILSRYEQRMAMAMLADFLFFGHEARGAFALVQDRTKLFRDSLDTYLNRICGVVNTVAIPRLLRLNGMDTALAPELTHSDVAEIDLQQLSAYITAMSAAGLIDATDPQLRRHLMEVADLPVANQAGDTADATPEGDALETPS